MIYNWAIQGNQSNKLQDFKADSQNFYKKRLYKNFDGFVWKQDQNLIYLFSLFSH
jgi:hypothetical protein